MKVSRKQANILKNAVEHWNNKSLLDDKTANLLQQDIEVIPFDWKKLAKYSFWVALVCIITSVGAMLADKAILELLEKVFNSSHIIKFFSLSFIAALFYLAGIRNRTLHPHRVFSNEAILFLAVMVTAGAIYQLGCNFKLTTEHYSLLFLMSFIVYGILGHYFKSNLIWLFAMISIGSWMGAETGYASGWGAYYLGMNYPLRFVIFGGLLTIAALLFERKIWFEYFFQSTLAMGLLYLFISLWIMSIFGNYGDMTSWNQVKQIELFHWSLLFGLTSAGAIFHGLRFDNGMTKGFGITFLFINLYSRFFEYFWNSIHKAIIFAILGLSFWFLGSHAEKIWQMGSKKNAP